jgi:hypothetical protein
MIDYSIALVERLSAFFIMFIGFEGRLAVCAGGRERTCGQGLAAAPPSHHV